MEKSEFTLTVMSPSDKFPSLVLDYDPSWSVKDLKQRLSETYPTHPSPHLQRLIYAGQLLSDEACLSTLFQNSLAKPTLHLVCRNPVSSKNSPENPVTPPSSSAHTIDPLSSIPADEMQQYQRQYYEYLKEFYVTNSVPPTTASNDSSSPDNIHPMQTAGWPFFPWWGMNGASPHNYFYYPMHAPNLTPTSSQAEANGAAAPGQSVLPDLSVLNQGVAPQAPAEVANAPAQQPPVQQQVPQQQQPGMLVGNQMAAGLMGADELGENGGNLDIVDRFYMLFRLTLFIGLCFAYSSLDKAVIVFSVAAYVYFYNIYRRHAAIRRAAAAAAAAAATDHHGQPQPNPSPSSTNTSSTSTTNDNASDQQPGTSEIQLRHRLNPDNPPPETPQPVVNEEARLTRIAGTVRLVFTVFFQFFSSLITSLIPEQPPPIRLD